MCPESVVVDVEELHGSDGKHNDEGEIEDRGSGSGEQGSHNLEQGARFGAEEIVLPSKVVELQFRLEW